MSRDPDLRLELSAEAGRASAGDSGALYQGWQRCASCDPCDMSEQFFEYIQYINHEAQRVILCAISVSTLRTGGEARPLVLRSRPCRNWWTLAHTAMQQLVLAAPKESIDPLIRAEAQRRIQLQRGHLEEL